MQQEHEEVIQFELNVETIAILGKETGPSAERSFSITRCPTSTCTPPTCCP
jgi:hypothetical protein